LSKNQRLDQLVDYFLQLPEPEKTVGREKAKEEPFDETELSEVKELSSKSTIPKIL